MSVICATLVFKKSTLVMSWCCTHQLLNTHFEIHLGILYIAVGKNGK